MFAWFERLIDPFQPYDDSKPPNARLGAFFRETLWPARWVVGAAALLSLAVAIADALMVYFAGDLITRMSRSTPETFWESEGDALLWMIVIVLLVRPAAAVIDRFLIGQSFFPNMGTLIRWRTHRHILRQSMGFFADDFAGRIATKQIQLAPAFAEVVFQLLDAVWYSLVFFIVAAVLFIELDARLLIPLCVWFALYVSAAVYFVPRIAEVGKNVADARSRLSGRIVDSYTNIQTVKLFAHAQREETYAREALEDMRGAICQMTRRHTQLSIAIAALNIVLFGGVIGFGVVLWADGSVAVGAVAAGAALALRLQGMSDWILWTLSGLFENVGVVQEGLETVSQPLRLQDAPEARPLILSQGAVRFEKASHRYGRGAQFSGKGVGIENVDLDIAPGEKVGLVGPSGAGKSTLVNLLLRFFDPEVGRVLVDEQDVARVTQESLRASIGMVTQDTSLLHRSIRENIAYGWPDAEAKSPDAVRAAVVAAAEKVAAHEFIEGLSDREGRRGYEAMVGERGVKLSGGQRQRIALARVVLKDAPILVLDEATSALDSEVEAAILEAMETLMRGKTVIAIAHRLSTIAQMDRIVVMERGRIVEQGSHSALLNAGGLYARLWSRQSGGFLAKAAS